ncbi:MAG: polysaccharide biosynthesis tyrosine autokinase [Cyanobium sp.]|nr:polysaccharide biosynthesis tyrosine autokinase [Cyanobium sp.]
MSLARIWRVILRRRRPFVLAAVLVTGYTFAGSVHQELFEPTYEGQFTLLISDPINTSGRSGQGDGGSIETLARNNQAVDVPTLIAVLQSNTVLEPVYNQMRKMGYQAIPSPSVQLVNAMADGSGGGILAGGVLQIRASGGERSAVEQMLRLTQRAYIEWSLSQRQAQLSQGLTFLDQQEPKLQARNAQLQAELRRFRQEHNVISPDQDAEALSSRMLALQSSLLELSATRRQLLDIERDVRAGRLSARTFGLSSGAGGGGGSGGGGGGASLSAGLPNQGLLDEWQRLQAEIGAARGLYQPGSPVLRDLQQSQERLRPLLIGQQLVAVRAALRQNTDATVNTRSQLQQLEGQFRSQPQLLSEFQALQQRIEIAAGNLSNYLKTRDQFQLEIAQKTSPWQVISPTSVQRSSAGIGLSKGFLRALMLGAVAGLAAAIAKDRLDHVFHSPQEVEGETGQPLLGHMPYVQAFDRANRNDLLLLDGSEDTGADDAVGRYQRFFYQESLRNLYTSLRFAEAGSRLRSISITSSVPAEGKSLVGILLAKTLGELGVRVLMVDADLRRPQLHHRLGLDNLRGLSNLLTEPDLDWQQVVHTVADVPNLEVITAGRAAPNPPRLLSSDAMGALVRRLADSGRYDVVLYDAPPVLGLADAALLAEQLDGVVLLVSLNRVDRSLPLEAVKRIRMAKANLVGIVTTAMRPKGEEAGAYAYSYGRALRDPYSYRSYGALDPSSAYAYYEGQDGETTGAGPRTLKQRWQELNTSRPAERLQQALRRFNRWLDGN